MSATVPNAPRKRLLSMGWPAWLLPFIPLAVILDLAHAEAVLVFSAAALGVVPTAALMGRATEDLALRSGPGIGGLLNVTFGNAPELIIALFALGAGLHEVVKASIVGSIIGNILLVLGASMVAGGFGADRRLRERSGSHPPPEDPEDDLVQTFSATAASAQSSMLLLAIAATLMPAIYVLVDGEGLPSAGAAIKDFEPSVEKLSLIAAGVLIGTYVIGLLFSLRTHRDLFNPEAGEPVIEEETWSVRRAVAMLAIAGAAVAWMSEILVGSIEETAQQAGLSEFFIGAVIVAIVGNAAEHWVAVLVAYKNTHRGRPRPMDLAVNISIGSSAQVALFVAPVLVFASYVLGPGPMPLVFNGFELAALVLAALIANQTTQDGKSTWFEGAQLLAVYAIIAVAFALA